jgi:urease accessory protein
VRAVDRSLLLADLLRFHPSAGDAPTSIGLLGGHDVVGTLHVMWQRAPRVLVDVLHDALADVPDVLTGVSELANRCGAAVRLLAQSS